MQEIDLKRGLLLMQLPGALLGSLLMAAIAVFGYGRMRVHHPDLGLSVLLFPLGVALLLFSFTVAVGTALLLTRPEQEQAQPEEQTHELMALAPVVADPTFVGGARDWWFGQ